MHNQSPDARESLLVDFSKRGTLIFGEYRCGSHYLQNLCSEICKMYDRPYQNHKELLKTSDRLDRSMVNRLEALSTDVYHLAIINQLELKMEVLKYNMDLDDWHVVRVLPDDRDRWFISWYFYVYGPAMSITEKSLTQISVAKIKGQDVWFVGNGEGGDYFHYDTQVYITSWNEQKGVYHDPNLINSIMPAGNTVQHHGTSKNVYENFMSRYKILPFPVTEWHQLFYILNGHMAGVMIPCDKEILVSDLPVLATPQQQWLANTYPEIDIVRDFENGWYIKELLDRWRPFAGLIKGKK